MNTEKNMDLEGQIKDKEEELENRRALLARYAKTYGRDRWYNRGCHDITTIQEELMALRAMRENGIVGKPSGKHNEQKQQPLWPV